MQDKKVKEIEIQGELGNLDPIIASVAAERHFKNCDFDVRPVDSRRTNSFALFDIFIIERAANVSKIPIGAFTLQLLGTNRVILRVPPPSQRTWNHLTPDEKIQMGLNEGKYNEHFKYFIKELDDVITHRGLKATWQRKIWQEIKDFLATIIAKIIVGKSK
jgi:hypothetical protein